MAADYEAEHGRDPVTYALGEIGGGAGRGLSGTATTEPDLLGGISVELIDADSGASGVMQGPAEEPPLKRRRLAEESGAHFTQALARQVEIKREEVADEQDERGYQVRFTDALQSKFDELAKVAIAGGADAAAVCACRAGR